VDEGLIVSLVKQERYQQPRMGGRKLYHVLKGKMGESGIKIGRDRFFCMLRRQGLTVPRLPRTPRTTQSRHALPVFNNLTVDTEVTQPDQVWVSDLTYLRTEEGFDYLAIIMDRYSRKIVGYHCGDTLETISCLQALEKALKNLSPGAAPIHHSDRGSQYCSHAYVERLWKNGFQVSMTQENHCYENAHAERVIGILKQEYGLRMTYRSREQVRKAVDQAIRLYNNRRPHTSLNYKTPAMVHGQAA